MMMTRSALLAFLATTVSALPSKKVNKNVAKLDTWLVPLDVPECDAAIAEKDNIIAAKETTIAELEARLAEFVPSWHLANLGESCDDACARLAPGSTCDSASQSKITTQPLMEEAMLAAGAEW